MTKRTMTAISHWPNFSLEVNFTVYPGDPGKYSGPPEKCYPAEDPSLEIHSVLLNYPAKIPGLAIDLLALDLIEEFGYSAKLEAALWEHYHDECKSENEA